MYPQQVSSADKKKYLTLSVPSLCIAHLDNFYTHTIRGWYLWEMFSWNQWKGKYPIPRYLHWHIYHFSLRVKKIHRDETDIIWRFKMGNMFKFLLHSELTCTIFQCIIWAVISFAMGNPRRLFIFSHELKSDKLKGAF